MQRKLKGMEEKYQMLKVRFDETECKNIQLLQEREQQKERQKQEKLILQDFERKNAQLQEFCNEMKDKTTELEREKEKVEKWCSEMQRRINGMAKNNSELINGIMLNFKNLRRENTEMQAEKQQQEKIHEDL